MSLVRQLSALVALSIVCTGCCSIVRKSDYPVSFTSTPPGAAFTVTNQEGAIVHKGVTPATITLHSSAGYMDKADYTVDYALDGYAPLSRPLAARLDPWFWGNIVFGGLIGMLIVDPLTGAMWKLDAECNATLVAAPAKP